MPRPSSQCPGGSHIPQKNLLVSAHAGKARVVFCDGEVEDFVAVGAVGLDQAGFWGGGGGFQRVVEVDGAVGGAGEDLGEGGG